MTSRYLTAIRKLLKSYHKRFDCFGKPVKKTKRKKNGRWCYTVNYYRDNFSINYWSVVNDWIN